MLRTCTVLVMYCILSCMSKRVVAALEAGSCFSTVLTMFLSFLYKCFGLVLSVKRFMLIDLKKSFMLCLHANILHTTVLQISKMQLISF